MSNTFGTLFRLSTFGESHGAAIGAVIDGCPAGVPFDLERLRLDLRHRRPGGALASSRVEADEPDVLSGVFDGITTGAPIAVLVRNQDQRSADYAPLRDLYRPSHADFTYQQKYGLRDYRGGGRASARETLARVIGGSVARMLIDQTWNIDLRSGVMSIGPIESARPVGDMDPVEIYSSPVRCDDPEVAVMMADRIEMLRSEGDSSGGVVATCVRGIPVGVGEPVYDKLSSRLAAAMMSINGATGVEFGAGFAAARRRGSENNDQFAAGDSGLLTTTNNSGGIQGGISNGMPVEFRVAFKPPSSIALPQDHGTLSGGVVEHRIEGRHDPTIVIRAVPVVEAMTLLVLADLLMLSRASATFVPGTGG